MTVRCAFVIPGDIDLPTGGYAYDRRVLAGLPAHGVAVHHVALPGSFPAPPPADLAVTEAIIGAEAADTVLLIDGLALGAMPRALLARVRQPIVAICHHPLALEAGLSSARAAELHASEMAALALARHVLVPSPTTGRVLAADFGVARECITIAEPGTERAARATGTGATPGGPVSLVAVGSVVPRKAYDVLVAALAGLAGPGHPPWRLAIAGADDRSPETTAALHRQIAEAGLGDRVRVLGAQTEAEVAALYAGADVFLLSSLYEGYGMVLTEAMARGLPIVCTTGGAAAETVPDAAAIKVPPGDAMAFRAAVARVLADAGLRRRMSDAAWTAAARLPTWDDTARIVAGVISTVGKA